MFQSKNYEFPVLRCAPCARKPLVNERIDGPILPPLGVERALLFIPVSDRGALRRLRRLRGVELPVALFDAASSLVPGNDDTDMVRASPLACCGDFLLGLAVCQGENLITERRRTALIASWFCGRRATTPACPGCIRWLRCRGWRLCGRRPSRLLALTVAREHSLGCLQFAELAGELLALRIGARQRLTDPLLLFGDLLQGRHSTPSG